MGDEENVPASSNLPGNSATQKAAVDDDQFDFTGLNPGDKYKNQTILDILFSTRSYIIFTTVESPKNISYYYSGSNCEQDLGKIQKDLIKLIAALKLNNEVTDNLYYLASIYAVCLGGDPDGAKELINALYAQSSLGEKIRKIGKINYLSYCLGITISAILASIFLHYRTDQQHYYYLILYVKLATLGSVSGYISIAIKISTTQYNFDKDAIVQILSAVSRIFISMFSAIAVFIFIKSKLVFGFLNDSNSNQYLVYSFALLAGFSETFIPDVFKVLEKQTSDKLNNLPDNKAKKAEK